MNAGPSDAAGGHPLGNMQGTGGQVGSEEGRRSAQSERTLPRVSSPAGPHPASSGALTSASCTRMMCPMCAACASRIASSTLARSRSRSSATSAVPSPSPPAVHGRPSTATRLPPAAAPPATLSPAASLAPDAVSNPNTTAAFRLNRIPARVRSALSRSKASRQALRRASKRLVRRAMGPGGPETIRCCRSHRLRGEETGGWGRGRAGGKCVGCVQ
jgi:hypothetical protein